MHVVICTVVVVTHRDAVVVVQFVRCQVAGLPIVFWRRACTDRTVVGSFLARYNAILVQATRRQHCGLTLFLQQKKEVLGSGGTAAVLNATTVAAIAIVSVRSIAITTATIAVLTTTILLIIIIITSTMLCYLCGGDETGSAIVFWFLVLNSVLIVCGCDGCDGCVVFVRDALLVPVIVVVCVSFCLAQI